MFEKAVHLVHTLPAVGRADLLERLYEVRRIGHNFGYGAGDYMDFLLAKYPEGAA